MRLALINIGQETNDFNPVPTTLRDFRRTERLLIRFNVLGGGDCDPRHELRRGERPCPIVDEDHVVRRAGPERSNARV